MLLKGAAAAGVAGAAARTLRAQAFPARPLRLVVGFAPAGANDLLARVYAARMQGVLGQPVVVENRPGANSIIAAELVAKAPADGYTLLVASNGALAVNPAIYARLGYEPATDFEVLGVLAFYPSVLIVGESSGLTSLASMRALSVQRELNHGVGSSLFHLGGEYFARQAGLRTVHVNYKGNAPTVTAVAAGEVDYAIVDLASSLPLLKGGKLRALGVTSRRRSASLPDTPTIAEMGLPKFEMMGWTSIVAPSGLPAAVSTQLRAAIDTSAGHPGTLTQLQRMGMERGAPADAAFARRVATERAQWTEIAKAAGIKAD
jgi:tripartite-type tricarboxylate transporter receptor subunit TctC